MREPWGSPVIRELQPRPENGITVVLGDQGYGKSTLYKKILWANREPSPRLYRPVFAWDYGTKIREHAGLYPIRGMTPETFARFCLARSPCVAAADEGDKLYPSSGAAEGSALDELCCYGRNAQPDPALPWPRLAPVSLILVCRRPLELAPKLRSSADTFFLFRVSDEDDRKTLRKDCGVPRSIVDELAELPPLEFRRYDKR